MDEQMQTNNLIKVEVCHCAAERIFLQTLLVAAGSRIDDVLDRSNLFAEFPALDRASMKFGVFGKFKSAENTLHDGDRVEVYRELKVDPMEARRRRVTKKTKRNTRTF